MSTLQLYGKFGANLMGGESAADAVPIDLLSDTIRVTLHTSTYVPNIDTHEAFSDATNELSTANGYTANGIACAGKTTTYNATGNLSTFDHDDTTITWTASGGSLVFQYAVYHDDTITTGPPAKPLIGYIDCGAQTITTGNSFGITTGASGLIVVTVT